MNNKKYCYMVMALGARCRLRPIGIFDNLDAAKDFVRNEWDEEKKGKKYYLDKAIRYYDLDEIFYEENSDDAYIYCMSDDPDDRNAYIRALLLCIDKKPLYSSLEEKEADL